MSFSKFARLGITAFLISSPAFAAETDLMICRLDNGGSVRLTANENQQLNLYFDESAKAVLGIDKALNLNAVLEAVDSGSTRGAIDFMEAGAGYNGPSGDCGMGLDFAYNTTDDLQAVGTTREIRLKPGKSGYRMVSCGTKSLGVVACVASGSIGSVTGLKRHLRTIIGD